MARASRTLDAIAGCDPASLDPHQFNQRVIAGNARPGQGLFIAALRRRLHRRGLTVHFDEHHLIVEISGR